LSNLRKKLDIEKNKELVKRINKYLNYGDQFKNVDWLDNNITFNRFVTDVLIKTDSISYLSIDLDNDGKTDNVVKYEEGICQSRVYSKILMLLNENREEIDEARTQRLFSKLERSGFPGYLTNRHYKVYDIFFYKNEVYIDIWDGRISELTVYSIVKNKLCEICEYKFINKEEK